jgi:hypothetical protein
MALADIVVPEILGQMVLEQLQNKILDFPGVDTTTEFAVGTNGTKWEIPYQKLIGDFQVDGEGVTLVPTAATQDTYAHIVNRRGQAYKVPSIDRLAAYRDPGLFLAEQIAQAISKEMQANRFRILEGAVPSANRHTVSGSLTDDEVTDAKMLIGDKFVDLKIAAMHSSVYKSLFKAGQIAMQPVGNIVPVNAAQTNMLGIAPGTNVATISGLQIFITDGITTVSGSPDQYVTYLLGQGAMGLFYQRAPLIEYTREYLSDGGYDIIIPRMDFVQCLHGTDYTSTSYTDANLSDTDNYDLKWDQKEVKAVRIISN